MFLPTPRFRLVGATLTALAGLINIASALYPGIPSRMEIVQDLVPFHLIRATHTGAVITGFLLILLADGLRRRRRRALVMTVTLLLLAGVLNMVKGLDFEEATFSLALALALVHQRAIFSVAGAEVAPRMVAGRVAWFASLYYCYVLGGFLVLRHAVRPAPSVLNASLEPFRLVLGQPLFSYITPHAQWFSRSIAVVGLLALVYVLWQILRPLAPQPRASHNELSRVRELVRTYGSDTLSYFSFQHGRRYFFAPSGHAFVSYRIWGSVALAGGGPIGRESDFHSVVQGFIDFAYANGLEPCFLGISDRERACFAALGLRCLKIGEEALIDLRSFDPSSLKRKVRRAVRHTEELGFRAVTYRADALPPELEPQLRAVSRDWVDGKGGAERGFSMTLGRLPGAEDPDCEITLAMLEGQVLGYVSMAPVYASNSWSLDAMRRRPDAPNGLMEFLVVSTARQYARRGYSLMSLNFATLANSQDDIESRLVDSTRAFLYEQLSSLYQLKSLHQFNDKFAPEWRSRYLVYRDALKIPKLAVAIVQSEDPIRLPRPLALLRR